MLTLTQADLWFPPRVAKLIARPVPKGIEVCVELDSEAVEGQFERTDRANFIDEIAKWLSFIGESSWGAVPGRPIDAWAGSIALRIAEHFDVQ